MWEVRRADASIPIKVLRTTTESSYGFMPSYRKTWMAKQKAVARIYGDWDESYTVIPHATVNGPVESVAPRSAE
ncbi:hypothetical protein PIB30_058357 [Stylosanthes scabra]|uniref:Uncharacterized protein n=1 Tax=Stylosanthes scabra TaxID=79078 RepID=A0ABU6RK96_9FABA|nr:hypothetical protein [Stylosanthes scabra]